MVESPNHVQRLRKAADEMRRENQNGWPLTCDAAADEIESLHRQIAELLAELATANADRCFHTDDDPNCKLESTFMRMVDAARAENARLRALPLKDEVEGVVSAAREVAGACAGDNKPTIGWAREVRSSMDALLSRLRAGEQEGWRLVPVEPTEEMIEAGIAEESENSRLSVEAVWEQMLLAAPSEQGGDRQ